MASNNILILNLVRPKVTTHFSIKAKECYRVDEDSYLYCVRFHNDAQLIVEFDAPINVGPDCFRTSFTIFGQRETFLFRRFAQIELNITGLSPSGGSWWVDVNIDGSLKSLGHLQVDGERVWYRSRCLNVDDITRKYTKLSVLGDRRRMRV